MTNRALMEKYIESDLWIWMNTVSFFSRAVNFQDNFQSFLVKDLPIPAGKQAAITNNLQNGLIPSGRIILRQQGDANIIDGNAPWTQNYVYLQNPSANDAVVTVVFFI